MNPYLYGESDDNIGRDEAEKVAQEVNNATSDIESIGDVYRSKRTLQTRSLSEGVTIRRRGGNQLERIRVVGHVDAGGRDWIVGASIRIEEHIDERAQRVLEEVHEQKEAVGEAQKEQVDARRVIAEALLHKHVHAQAVADQSDENEQHGDKDVQYAHRLVELDRAHHTLTIGQAVFNGEPAVTAHFFALSISFC